MGVTMAMARGDGQTEAVPARAGRGTGRRWGASLPAERSRLCGVRTHRRIERQARSKLPAAAQRRPDPGSSRRRHESFEELRDRLDAALRKRWDDDVFVDEING